MSTSTAVQDLIDSVSHNSVIEHHGVKGMHWGIRKGSEHHTDAEIFRQSGLTGKKHTVLRDANNRVTRVVSNRHLEKHGTRPGEVAPGSSSNSPASPSKEGFGSKGGPSDFQTTGSHHQWKKGAKSQATGNAALMDAIKNAKKDINYLANSPAYKGHDLTKDGGLAARYNKQWLEIMNNHLADTSALRTYNPKINRAVIYQLNSTGTHMSATIVKLVHVDDESLDISMIPDIQVIRDEKGFVTDLVPDMAHSLDTPLDEFLEHHGVKGQKWGVRNARGHFTESGTSGAKGHFTPASDLSNEELKKAVDRLNLEKQYNTLYREMNKTVSEKNLEAAKKFIGGIAGTAVKSAITGSATKAIAGALTKSKG